VTNSQQQDSAHRASPFNTRAARLLIRLGWVAALSVVLIALFAGSFYLTMRVAFTGREVSVPEVTGLAVEDARAALARVQLFLETSAERYDDHVAKGMVLSQDPRAGSTTKKDRKVRVTVSLGPTAVSVPDVRGQSLRSSQIALQRESLGVGHVTSVHDAGTLSDVVMAQRPERDEGAAGLVVVGGKGKVDLLVSRGRPDTIYVMPDLSRRTLAEVTAFAQRAGLRLGAVRRERVAGVKRGTVARQYPEAGYPVGRQDIISLVVGE